MLSFCTLCGCECVLVSLSFFSCYHFLSHQHLSCFLPPCEMSQLVLLIKVSISMTSRNVQLLRAWQTGNWDKVTQSNWCCVQSELHRCFKAATLLRRFSLCVSTVLLLAASFSCYAFAQRSKFWAASRRRPMNEIHDDILVDLRCSVSGSVTGSLSSCSEKAARLCLRGCSSSVCPFSEPCPLCTDNNTAKDMLRWSKCHPDTWEIFKMKLLGKIWSNRHPERVGGLTNLKTWLGFLFLFYWIWAIWRQLYN